MLLAQKTKLKQALKITDLDNVPTLKWPLELEEHHVWIGSRLNDTVINQPHTLARIAQIAIWAILEGMDGNNLHLPSIKWLSLEVGRGEMGK